MEFMQQVRVVEVMVIVDCLFQQHEFASFKLTVVPSSGIVQFER